MGNSIHKEINETLSQNLKLACQGQKIYKKILKRLQYGIEQSSKEAIILFPSNDNDINYYGLLYLDEYLMRNNKEGAIIITCNDVIVKCASIFSQNVSKVTIISQSDMQKIIALYNLVNFDNNLVVLSLDDPYERNGSKFVGINSLTLEMVIAIGVYFLIPFSPATKPISYFGSDVSVSKFVNR